MGWYEVRCALETEGCECKEVMARDEDEENRWVVQGW